MRGPKYRGEAHAARARREETMRRLWASDMTNVEIAKHVGVTPPHLERIARDINLPHRTEKRKK